MSKRAFVTARMASFLRHVDHAVASLSEVHVMTVVLAGGVIIVAIAVMYVLSRRRHSPYRYYTLEECLPPREGDGAFVPEHFVIVDLETTGLNADTHEIIELAALKVQRDPERHTTFTALVQPAHPVPSAITALTGITQAMLDHQGQPVSEVMAAFLDFVGEARVVFFNAPFDGAFLAKAANRLGRTMDNPVSCALDMARRAWPGLSSYKLSALAHRHGLDTRGHHRALTDCALTLPIYCAAATQLGSVD
jgi:DNA polymerase III epsilon subunit family exonuclease